LKSTGERSKPETLQPTTDGRRLNAECCCAILRSIPFRRTTVLVELRLENYAVIDHLAVEFAPGLNLLTGETGAGKSILIDALALLMGEKASPEVIRFGSDRAVISAVFEIDGAAEKLVARILENNGIDSDEANLILRREIAAKGRVFVNNQPATVAVLKQLAPHLAGIHAQNESLVSFDAVIRLDLLDTYANAQLGQAKEAFEKWKQVKDRMADIEQGEHDRLKLVDLWVFQKREIEDAKIQQGEDERLETQKRVLANAEKIYNSAMQAFDLLYEGTASTSASLRAAQKHLEELIRYEPKFQEALASLDTARISVEDVGASLRDYAGGIEASPERLAEIEDRLALLGRLKRKYGPSLEDVMNLGAEVTRKLSEIENKDEILRQLHKELAVAAENYLQAARVISKKRYESAKRLERIVEAEINDWRPVVPPV
jgi:DNA repair protein RecN (Recombination protein N)